MKSCTFPEKEGQDEDNKKILNQSHAKGQNFLIFSDASKPIFCRFNANVEELSTACSILQAIRSSAVDVLEGDDIVSIRSKRTKYTFLSVGSLTLLSLSQINDQGDCETDLYLRMQLEYVYCQIIFSLTDHVQNIFFQSPNFDLRDLLGSSVSDVQSIIDKMCHTDHLGPFLLCGIEVLSPISFAIRHHTSKILASCCNTKDILFVILSSGSKVITLVQPKNAKYQLETADLLLILNFVDREGSIPKDRELWIPLCLPHFNPSSFLYAYHKCLDVKTDLRLIIISQYNSTETFNNLRKSSLNVEKKLGITSQIEKQSGNFIDNIRLNEQYVKFEEIRSKNGHLDNVEGDCNYFMYSVEYALNEINQQKLMQHYLNISSAIHFVFRYQTQIRNSKNNNAIEKSISQCFNPSPKNAFSDDISSRRVWNMYQRLCTRLRLGSTSTEAVMDAFEMLTHGDTFQKHDINQYCPAQNLMKSSPYVQGVTFVLEGDELFIGLNGKGFELFVTLPAKICPKDGAALSAKLARTLMNDKNILFISNPLSFRC